MLKLRELLHVVNEDIYLNINGRPYGAGIPQEYLDFEIVALNGTGLDIEIKKPVRRTLEELGYSFEVGV